MSKSILQKKKLQEKMEKKRQESEEIREAEEKLRRESEEIREAEEKLRRKVEEIREAEEKLKKKRQEIEEDEQKDDDIEIEDFLEDRDSREIFKTLLDKTKDDRTQLCLDFLAKKCPSVLEALKHLLEESEKVKISIDVDDKSTLSSTSSSSSSYSSGSQKVSKSSITSKSVPKCEEKISMFVERYKLDKETYLIYGPVQSGKTNFVLSVTMAHIMINVCPVIVILRNCRGDAQQLSNRCSYFMKEQMEYFKGTGICGNSIKCFYVGGNKSDESLRRAFTNCNMIVAIANKTQLSKLAKVIKDFGSETRYVTIVDEADSVAYGDDDVEFRSILHENILEKSGRTYDITATTFNVMFTEKKIKSKNIIKLHVDTEKYRGLRNIRMKIIDHKDENSLTELLKNLGSRNAYEHEMGDVFQKNLIRTDHPLIILIKKYHKKLDQNELARKIVDVKNWGEVIVYNGDGLVIYTKYINALKKIITRGVIGEKFKINGKSVEKSEREGKRCLIVKAHIDEGMQYFKELHMSKETRRITHLAIVSDMMAARGISFVSKDYKWHLTTEYYEPQKYAQVDNIMQSIRLCGRYEDDLPSVLYAPKKVCYDLKKAFLLQEEMVNRCKDSEIVKSVPKLLKKMPIRVEKIPKRAFGPVRAAEIPPTSARLRFPTPTNFYYRSWRQ